MENAGPAAQQPLPEKGESPNDSSDREALLTPHYPIAEAEESKPVEDDLLAARLGALRG